MKVIGALVFLVFIAIPSIAQLSIKGRVVNARTGEPIPGSSVFISNTSKGTIADRDGQFSLTEIPTGKYELIVSSIGFETNVYPFTSQELPLTLRIEMAEKVRELQNVIVEPSVEETWEKWGKTFTDYFLGQTPNAWECKLRNYKSIRFRFYRKSNRLVAYSDEQLVIENKALGYVITYQMENFEINFAAGSSVYAGYPLFTDMTKPGKKIRSKWKNNRTRAYIGSMTQFMRGVYNNNLEAQGFEVRRMRRIMNTEKERIKALLRKEAQAQAAQGRTISSLTGSNKDSANYYDKILGQKDYEDQYGRVLLKADSILVGEEEGYKHLLFEDYLHITFKREIEDPNFLLYTGERRPTTFQQSLIKLAREHIISIDSKGNYFPPQEVYSMGYWAWDEKMSSMLPLDYEP